MSKSIKNNYCGIAVINDRLFFVCTKNKDITVCGYKTTSRYQMCPFKFEEAHGIQVCNCTKAQINVMLDLNIIQSGLNFAESK
jgi:hypothetical protein